MYFKTFGYIFYFVNKQITGQSYYKNKDETNKKKKKKKKDEVIMKSRPA